MPIKRTFGDFQDAIEFFVDPSLPISPSSLQFPTSPASTRKRNRPPSPSPSPNYTQDFQPPWYESPQNRSKLPALRRCTSLPTLDKLRKLSPLTLLTTENLKAMDPTCQPITPDRTVSGRSKSSTTGSAQADNGRRMGLVGLIDPDAGNNRLDERTTLQEAVQEIVGGSRSSSLKKESARVFRKTLSKLKMRNETTIAERLMPFLVTKHRMVPTNNQDEASLEDRRTTLRSFELDHLDWNINKEFSRDSVPFPADEKGNPSNFGIKNPKPDITYGFEPDAFNIQQQKALLTFEPELSRGIISPFLAIEWKSFGGSMQVGKDQARRDGAAMVQSRRKAIEKISYASMSAESLDLLSMVFSCVINEEAAHINIHWAEESNGEIKLFMAVVKRCLLQEDDGLRTLRRSLHNILDWGLSDRLMAVKSEVDKYREQLDVASAVDAPSAKRRRVDERLVE